MESKDIEVRVSVLETKVEHHTSLLGDHKVEVAKFIARFDEHTEEEAKRDAVIHDSLGHISIAVGSLTSTVAETNQTLKAITDMATTSKNKLLALDTIWMTLTKIAVVVASLVAGGWALYSHIINTLPK